jgi:iron(III) transport system substrate-binding protein
MPRASPLCLVLVAAGAAACERSGERVVVYTSLDDVFSRPILEAFERETGIAVDPVFDVEATKTTGLYQRLLAEKDRPRADVFWSSEVVRTVQLEKAGVLAQYVPKGAEAVPEGLKSRSGAWTGFAARARVIIYHTGRVPAAEAPRSIRDLASGRFRGEAGIAEPLFGTTATHAGALRARLGAPAMEEYFRSLAANGVKALGGNSVVRDRVASGELKVGLTDTDDAIVAIEKGLPVAIVFPDQEAGFPGVDGPLGTFVIPNTVAVIAGAPHPGAARKLADYLLRPETEEALARGESAQIPVRKGLRGPERLKAPADLVRMEVSFEEAARGLEESVEFLRTLFAR